MSPEEERAPGQAALGPSEPIVQGEASPPLVAHPSQRALQTMAVVRWALLAFVTALAAYSVWTVWGDKLSSRPPQVAMTQAQPKEVARYSCPMHPQIRSSEPGECPICHMALEPIPEERQGHSHAAHDAAQAAHEPAPPVPPGARPPNTTTVTLSEEKQRAVGIVTSEVEPATLGERLRVPGVITAPETGRSEVRVRAAGFVEKVAVRQTGVQVGRGQPLAYVYSPEIYRAEEEYLAALRWSESGSAAPGSPGASTPSSAGSDLALAARRGLELLGLSEADIQEVQSTGRPIRALAVRAPASGYVTRLNAVLGARAEPEMVLYEIADLSSVWVIASVSELDLGSIQKGTKALFSTSSSSEPITVQVDLVEPLLEEATRTFRVRVVLDNRKGQLRPGQYGEVEFELQGSAGLFVPRDAVIRTGQHEYVYVERGEGRFEPHLVRTGRQRAARVQIVSGLEAGERVVSRGSFMVDSESRLQASLAATPVPNSTGPARPPSAGPQGKP